MLSRLSEGPSIIWMGVPHTVANSSPLLLKVVDALLPRVRFVCGSTQPRVRVCVVVVFAVACLYCVYVCVSRAHMCSRTVSSALLGVSTVADVHKYDTSVGSVRACYSSICMAECVRGGSQVGG